MKIASPTVRLLVAAGTVSHLSRRHTVGAAKTYLPKATRAHTRRPHTVTLDGYTASHRAVREFSEHPPGRPIRIRSSKYLNNLIEQDHRAIKSRIRPMLGFKDFVSAQITLAGVELYIAFGKSSSHFANSERKEDAP